MTINVQFDTSALKAKTEREVKRLAFNTALALNETAKAVQLEERANLDRKFTIRKATFMYRLIKIFKFASARQGRPWAEIGIDPTKARVLLQRFEKGGVRPPFKGERVAVPVTGGPARLTMRESVHEDYTFRALRLKRRGKKGTLKFHPSVLSAPGPQLVGMLQTFSIHGKGIFQRFARGIRAVYLYVRRPKLDRTLGFIDIARRTIAREWAIQFKRAYRK